MNASYAIFEAEFRTSLRSSFQSFKKRFASTFFISILGIIFSFACIRLMNFVIQNPELFPEGSNEGYGTILLVYFSLFTLIPSILKSIDMCLKGRRRLWIQHQTTSGGLNKSEIFCCNPRGHANIACFSEKLSSLRCRSGISSE